MRPICLALLLATALIPVSSLTRPHVAIAQAADDGQAAFVAAGNDVVKLKAVAADHPDSVWGKLAAARVKVLDGQPPTNASEPTRQIVIEPKQPATEAPAAPVAATPAPEPQPEISVQPAPAEPAPAATPAEPAQNASVPTIRLAADGSGDYKSLSEAIDAAQPGHRIELSPGTYKGGLIVNKAIDFAGTGSFEQVIIEATGTDTFQWTANGGSITNLTVLQKGGCEKTCNAIYFNGGSALVEGSALTSEGGSTLYVQGAKASPRFVRNNIHNSKESGVYFEMYSGGSVEANDIANSGFAGIEVKSGAHPHIHDNNVRDGKQGGIFINTEGMSLVERNDVYGNAYSGIEIKDGANPMVRQNRIYNQLSSGVYINTKGRGNLINNEIYDNGQSNISVADGSSPNIIGNVLRNAKEGGVLFETGAKGLLESNEILASGFAGVEVRTDADPIIRKNVIRDGKESGGYVHSKGRGTFEDNDVNNNGQSGIEVSERGRPLVQNNRLTGNKEYAIFVQKQGEGTFTDNDLGNNGRGSSKIDKTAGRVKRSGNRE